MSDLNTYRIYPLNECAAVIDFGNIISEPVNNKVLSIRSWLLHHPFTGLMDTVAAYSSLTIYYDAWLIYNTYPPVSSVFDMVKARLEEACTMATELEVSSKAVSIPVCYDPMFGHDLALVAEEKNISVEELVHLHCSTSYRVYMLGFLPGFAYMGKIDERLVIPRKSLPREQVEAGSVGIAGWQTGVYPVSSPGGWQIIGRTPMPLFNPAQEPPVPLSAGDTVTFYPISVEEFENYTHVAHRY
jgi:inhibitor of KinA